MPVVPDAELPSLISSGHKSERERILHEVKSRVVSTQEGASSYNAMVNARRLFSFAATEMVNLLTRKGIDPHKAFDLIVASTKAAAARDIDIRQVLDPFLVKNGTMEWLGDKVEARVKDADIQAKQVKHEAEAERRKKPIPVEVEVDPLEGKKELPRGGTMVFHGPAGAVRTVLDTVATAAAESGCRVIKLISRDHKVVDTAQKNVIVIPATQWQGKGGDRRAITTLLSELILPVYGDLIVVDDLHLLSKPQHMGFKGGHVGAVAGDTHRDVRRLCQELGVCLAGGVGQTDIHSDADFDLTTAGWEQLKQFTVLLPATAEKGDTHYEVKVGNPPVLLATITTEQYHQNHSNVSRLVRE
jgi:hypothetical protein